VDHGINGRGRKIIDEYRVVMMCITVDLFIELVAKEQGLVVKVYLDVHGRYRLNRKLQTSNHKLFVYFRIMAEKLTYTPSEKAVAEKLLQVQAIRLNVKGPFTWSSGWKSPIYCDNRKVLSFPYIRDFVKSEMCNVLFGQFPEAALLAGVATAGIPWGAMAADQLKLPYIYVRSKPKEHGLGQQIEGYYEKGQPTVVIEDLISTGKSSLQVVEILKQAGLNVIGLVSIFNYDFEAGRLAFEKAGVPFISLSNYPTLISLALEKKIISPEEETVLLKWREDPANWQGV
jgi:orotate phosphoribosyltransferase